MQFFQRKFTVTSVIKFYSKMWELWVHPYCNHFYILYELPNKANSSHKPTFFSGNHNSFSVKPTVAWIMISEKGTSVFLVLNLFTFFKKDKIMVAKYQHSCYQGYFQVNLPDIDFTNEPCDVPQ